MLPFFAAAKLFANAMASTVALFGPDTTVSPVSIAGKVVVLGADGTPVPPTATCAMEMNSAGAPIMQSVDYSESTQEEQNEHYDKSIAKGGVTTPFPWKLHALLDDRDRLDTHSVVTWQPHGRSFMVHKPQEFVEKIMPHYFNQTKVSIISWFSLFDPLLLLLTSVF
jgi:hypothetical protein